MNRLIVLQQIIVYLQQLRRDVNGKELKIEGRHLLQQEKVLNGYEGSKK